MSVSAIIVTRGNVSLAPIMDSLPAKWEKIAWDNGSGLVARVGAPESYREWGHIAHATDLSVYGRYAAIEHASHDLIYVQDDDVIVSDPQKIVSEWEFTNDHLVREEGEEGAWDGIVANMPQEFRHDGYTDSCLVGFGACFHRDLPAKAWEKIRGTALEGLDFVMPDVFNRTCDVIFTTLTPRVLVDVPKVDREFASDPDRMWKQPDHYGERVRVLELARIVRDA